MAWLAARGAPGAIAAGACAAWLSCGSKTDTTADGGRDGVIGSGCGTPACQQEGPRIEDAGADISAQDIRIYPPDALFMPPDLAQADSIPKADPDAGTCSSLGSNPLLGSTLGVICFGSDPAPYQLYLTPADGGVAPGQCPTMSDFFWAGGESCGYTACGPLLGSAVAELPDAGAIIGDAGPSCCFLVARICGV